MKCRRAGPKIAEASLEEPTAIALEAIDRFARVLALTGMSRDQMAHAFQESCSRIPKRFLSGRRTLKRELFDAGHILTLWLSDPDYLNRMGEPLRIRSSGAKPSLEALIKRVNPKLERDQVIKFLMRTGSVIKTARGYSLKRRNVALSGNPELEYAHGLEAIGGLMRTIEHNVLQDNGRRGWFENAASNPRFPVRLRGQFDARLYRLGMDFLKRLDAEMQRAEQSRRRGEPTVRMRVQLYQCEDDAHRRSPRAQGQSAPGGRQK